MTQKTQTVDEFLAIHNLTTTPKLAKASVRRLATWYDAQAYDPEHNGVDAGVALPYPFECDCEECQGKVFNKETQTWEDPEPNVIDPTWDHLGEGVYRRPTIDPNKPAWLHKLSRERTRKYVEDLLRQKAIERVQMLMEEDLVVIDWCRAHGKPIPESIIERHQMRGAA